MILVTGATGNVGRELVRELLRAARPVRALVRGKEGSVPAGVEIAVGDLDRPESLGAALRGVRGVFLLGGRADMPGLLEEIRRAGVEHVVLLTSRSVVGGNPTNAIVAMWTASEAAVRSSGMPWTILRPSGYMSNALRWLAQLRAGDLIRAPFADVPIALIDPQDIAAVAAVVIGSDQHHGSSCELSGPEALVPAEQVRVLGTALGRDLRFEGQTEAEAREELSKIFPPSLVEAQLRFFAKGEFDDSRIAATVSEITGRPAGTFAQWARRHANRFAEGREGSS
ncbi:MAG: nucleoside-diphosphate sugar epimerase [Deltaproteobacteria bacterium]|nr:MAG: nucleoside-diphosphate sugar epimerase [Deltaproteobacteria bacterium]